MKNSFFIAGVASLFILASCGNSTTETTSTDSTATNTDTSSMPAPAPTPEGTQVAVANLQSTKDSTQNIGTAKFYQLTDGKIRLDVEINMKERADSNVAVHFHEHGDCGMKGENSHGHWNPTKAKHGEWGSASFHSGDIGNIMLDASGHATKSVTTDLWSVENGKVNDIIGKAIIVHGGTDDYKTQPTGNSGPRVGCGVITK